MSAALDVQDALETYDCRVFGCMNEAKANRGMWAYLCDDHIEAAKRGDRVEKTDADGAPLPTLRPATSRAARPINDDRSSFEAKAKGLVAVGKRLDKALERYRPAKGELDEAMAAWRSACRALAGEDTEA